MAKSTTSKLVNLNTDAAREVRVSYLAATVAGDTLALYVYADWLEETGHEENAKTWRRQADKYAAMDNDAGPDSYRRMPVCGGTWTQWLAWYELSRMASALVVACTSFTRLMYSGNYHVDGSFMSDDGSVEYAVRAHDYVPTLSRGNGSQAKLGRLCEAAGFRVYWVA